MRRSTRHALAVGFVFILAALCVAVPSVHAATEDSREKDEMLLNDAAAEGEQGMNKLLHWAIENSSPEELKQMAQQAGQGEQAKSLQERKKEFDEVMEQAKQLPNEFEIMKMSLTIAANSSEDQLTRVRALKLVQEFVEDIDLANDLPGMGGIDVLVHALAEDGSMQLQALRVLHTAAANNVKFQMKVLEKEAAIVPWLLQVVSDLSRWSSDSGGIYMCNQSDQQLELVLTALRAAASMSRNLPVETTMFLTSPEGPRPDDCFPSESNPTECSEPHLLPSNLRLLFMVAQMNAGCMNSEDTGDSYKRATHLSIARVALGLLSDLSTNDESIRALLQSKPKLDKVWQGGIFWAGICVVVKGKSDLPERAIHLLQSMFIPVPGSPEPCQQGIPGGWPCLLRLFEDVPDIEDSMPHGAAGPSLEQMKEWAVGVPESDPSIVIQYADPVRDDL